VLMRDRQLRFVDDKKTLENAKTANLDLMMRLSTLSF